MPKITLPEGFREKGGRLSADIPTILSCLDLPTNSNYREVAAKCIGYTLSALFPCSNLTVLIDDTERVSIVEVYDNEQEGVIAA